MRRREGLEQRITELKEMMANVKGKRTEVYTRIVGYYRPVSNWNKGKYSEFQDRQTYCNEVNVSLTPINFERKVA